MVAYNVYKSLEQILDYLREPSVQCDEVKELLSIYDKSKTRWTSDVHPVKLFLVFEGLDGSGKSTMTKLASKKLSCVQVVTPPDCIKHLRNYFDECEPKLRRAYYSLGNYIAAMEIRTILQTRPVVMDRFWHSTAAYAIAESSDDIPSKGDEIFKWPNDLLKPDVVIFLDVTEQIRSIRTKRRIEEQIETIEESRLRKNNEFRSRLNEAYSHMADLQFIDGNQYPKKVFDSIMKDVLTPILTAEKLLTSS